MVRGVFICCMSVRTDFRRPGREHHADEQLHGTAQQGVPIRHAETYPYCTSWYSCTGTSWYSLLVHGTRYLEYSYVVCLFEQKSGDRDANMHADEQLHGTAQQGVPIRHAEGEAPQGHEVAETSSSPQTHYKVQPVVNKKGKCKRIHRYAPEMHVFTHCPTVA
jgi:hypothetical protein